MGTKSVRHSLITMIIIALNAVVITIVFMGLTAHRRTIQSRTKEGPGTLLRPLHGAAEQSGKAQCDFQRTAAALPAPSAGSPWLPLSAWPD